MIEDEIEEQEDARAPSQHKAIAALEKWMNEHIHGSSVAQNTPVYNRVHALVQQVKQEIEKV